MIKLKVEEYCHNCSDFKPLVDKECYESGYGSCYKDTTITCKYAERCEVIAEYFKKQVNL